ncbi:MAG TPA: XRE family transcriptional regulator [Mycobacterium sp.]
MASVGTVVGRNVARMRIGLPMPVSELARRSGVSKATVLSIELGRANPTVGTLQSLANALGVAITDLLADDSAPEMSATVLRQDDAEWHPLGGQQIRPLATLYGAGMVYVFAARVNESGYRDDGHEAGSVESLYVLSGTVLAGAPEDPVTLGPGDFMRFTADGPHMYRSARGTAEALLVVGRNQIPDVGLLAPAEDDGRAV